MFKKKASGNWWFFYLKRGLIVTALFLWFILLVLSGFLFWYFHSFSQAAHIKRGEWANWIKNAFSQPPSSFNFLILGLDQRPQSNTLLTDTIMIGFFRPQASFPLTFISLPRDLWIDSLKTKINALYYYGQKNDPHHPTTLLKREIKTITGEDINYSIIVDFNAISDIIDCVGGIDIEVKRAFDDFYYPLDDGSGKTIHLHFDQGWQIMDGKRALEYIRSRKSNDLAEGTDEARVARQQQVVQALVKKMTQWDIISHPRLMGNLYLIWQKEVQKDIPFELILKLGWVSIEKGFSWRFFQLPDKLLFHPPLDKHDGLWVWEPKGGNWEAIREWVKGTVGN